MEESLPSLSKTMCSACGRYFSGITSFDAHRVGPYTREGRRCLSDDEMREYGLENEFRNVRCYVNGKLQMHEHLIWYSVRDREKLKQHFHATMAI